MPLRITLVGSDQDSESIRRGWGSVTEQPLDIRVIDIDRANSTALADAVSAAAESSDLMVYPRTLIARLAGEQAIVALSDDDFDQIDQACGQLLAALRAGVKYADAYLAIPLGAVQPALLSRERAVAVDSWQSYDELITSEWKGKASEPTAPGWAAAMFLWRTASSKQWLFDRESLKPLVGDESYVAALELMVQSHDRYQLKHQTPGQIWSAVRSGELLGGIGFPQGIDDGESEVQISELPTTEDSSRVLLDPFSPVISLSSNCRQSTAAKRFITWLSGGVGSESVRQQVTGMTEIRMSSTGASSDAVAGSVTSYDQWLATRLGSPITIPTLQVLRGGEYYAALDAQVTRALDGEATPQEALGEVAKRWQAITDEIGMEDQLRSWRRAQGMRT